MISEPIARIGDVSIEIERQLGIEHMEITANRIFHSLYLNEDVYMEVMNRQGWSVEIKRILKWI